jgi:hypothetical protein
MKYKGLNTGLAKNYEQNGFLQSKGFQLFSTMVISLAILCTFLNIQSKMQMTGPIIKWKAFLYIQFASY